MGKLLKWLFSLVFLLIILVVAAIIIVPMVVDPNDYKEQIVSEVKNHTGRDFQIEKDLTLSVFPWIGIETGGVTLGNAEGFKNGTMLEVDKLGVKVMLLPLLSGNVEVDTLELVGLNANLEVDKSGKTNWDDLAGEKEAAEAKANKKGQKKDKEAAVPIASLKIQGIRIEDANVSWDDRSKGENYQLQGLRIETGALEPETLVPVSLGLSLSSTKPQMAVVLSLNGEVKGNAKLNRFDVSDLLLNVSAKGEGLPAEGVKLKLSSNLVADVYKDSLQVSDLKLNGSGVAVSGQASIARMTKAPEIDAQLSLQETNVKTLAAVFAQPIETTDPNVLTKISSNLSLKMKNGGLFIDPLKLKLDDTNIDGYLRIPDMEGPIIRTSMNVDEIDVDRYMPPKSEAEQANVSSSSAAGKPAAGNPLGAIVGLDLEAMLNVGKLKVNNLRMNDVKLNVVSKNGVLTADPMAAKLYEGTFNGKVKLDARGKAPKLHAVKTLSDIQIGPLLKDLAGQDKLLGKGNVNLDIRIVGMTEQEIRNSLNGAVNFKFADGAYKGVNVAELLRGAKSKLSGGDSAAATDENAQTDFSELSASAKIKNGVITNNDLSAKSPLLRINGKGQVNLPADTVDYLVTTTLVGSLEGQGGKGGDELSGIPIPVRVKGPLTNPSYSPDLSAAVNAKAKQKIEKKKAEVKEKAKAKLEEKLQGLGGGALKGLFGR